MNNCRCPDLCKVLLPLVSKFDGSVKMLFVKPLKLRDFIAFSCFYFSMATAITFLGFSSLNNFIEI